MFRVITPESCSESGQFTETEKSLDKRRASFILKNKFRRMAGNRRLGVLWIALDPIIQSLIYLFVFIVIRGKLNPESLFIGITLWRLAAASVNSGMKAVQDYSGGLRSERIRTRALIIPILQYRVIDCFVSTVGVAAILYFYYNVPGTGVLAFLAIAQIMGVLFEGSSLNLYMITRSYPDLTNIISHFLRFMFFAGPVLYPMSLMSGWHYRFNEFNPFSYFAELSRHLCGIEGVYAELSQATFLFFVGSLVILTFRGYSKIDWYRWKVSTWS